MTPPEPIALHVVRWRCPFCPRARSSKKATAEHAARCWSNPDVRACRTCANYEVLQGASASCASDPLCCCPPDEEVCNAGIDISDGVMRTGCPSWTPEVAS